jgi:carboxymethylenebutenolidase
MGNWIKLTSSDGKELSAYLAKPAARAKGGVVVIQEIFGVNRSIRAVVEWLAGEGYTAIAPALFDRFEPGIELGYDDAGMQKAFSLYPRLSPDISLKDIAPAFNHIQGEGKGTAVLGFCYGGLMSWLSATRGPANGFHPTCTVGYYAGGIGIVAAEAPSCPVQLHFGKSDEHIGSDQVEAVRLAHPDVEIYTYENAGHAFANPDRPSYLPEPTKIANERAIEFLKKYLG